MDICGQGFESAAQRRMDTGGLAEKRCELGEYRAVGVGAVSDLIAVYDSAQKTGCGKLCKFAM